jgi:hypothetical protein
MPRNARQVVVIGNARERRHQRGCEGAGAAHVNVEADIRRRKMEIERFRGRPQRLGDFPGDLNAAVETFRKYRTAIDCDHAVGARGGKADFEHLVCAASCVQYGAAATGAVGVDKIGNRRAKANALQRLNNEVSLPRLIIVTFPMLDGAPPAYAKVRADWRNALWARGDDLHQTQPASVAGGILDVHYFTWQRARNVNRAAGGDGDTVAQMAEMID